MDQKIPNHFCPVPWVETYVDTIGAAHPCCLVSDILVCLYEQSPKEKHQFFNSSKFQGLRRQFLNGEKPSSCQQCWKMESLGIESRRQMALRDYKSEVKTILDRNSVEAEAPKRFDVRFSSKCNLQCKMCSPSNSDQIANTIKKMRAQGIENTFTRREFREDNQNEFLTEYIRLNPQIEKFLFAGGEPFIMPEFHTIIDEFVSTGRARRTDLHILTNLTAVKDSVLEKLVQFRDVDFSCSMDGIGPEFEYQRWPSRWEKCKSGFEKAVAVMKAHPNFKVTLTPCVTHLNLRCLGDFLEFAHQKKNGLIYTALNFVIRETQLDHRLVPLRFREPIARRIHQALNQVEENMVPENVITWRKFADSLLADEFEMTPRTAQRLLDAVVGWDFQKEQRWQDLYPWAPELLSHARNLVGNAGLEPTTSTL